MTSKTGRFVEKFEMSLSFSESAADDARLVHEYVGSRVCTYFYKSFLSEQVGMSVGSIARSVYGELPSIIFMTSDWFERPATIAEMKLLSVNERPKLVIDYVGLFDDKREVHRLENCYVSSCDSSNSIRLKDVDDFIMSWLHD